MNTPAPSRFIVLYYTRHDDRTMPPSIYMAVTHDNPEQAGLECLQQHPGVSIMQVVDMQNPQQTPIVWEGNA